MAEKRTRAERLRAVSRALREHPLETILSLPDWDEATAELTQDDFEHLRKLARGHLERAVDAATSQEPEAAEEARSAVLLWPRDRAWADEVSTALKATGWKGMEAEAFFVLMNRRAGKRQAGKYPRWLLPLVVVLAAAPIGLWVVLAWGPGLILGHPINRVQGPRTLEATFDTQGVKTNIGVAQSRMLIFPEATVAELSAWVMFPEQRVDLWEGTVRVLDPQGQVLTSREVTFHASSQGTLEPGQGVPVFEQFDVWPFFDRVSSFQVTTTRILAEPAQPKERRELPVAGLDALTPGYALKVWVIGDRWTDRFASKVHVFNLEVENTGLKPFTELGFTLRWLDGVGKTLKTLTFRPVSPYRTSLPPGSKLGWTQETVFDTEVFSWPPGGEPHPVVELNRWQ